jgi:hypothetical protein
VARTKLPDRRPSVTERNKIVLDGGKATPVLVTIGFADDAMTTPREVFCADWKAGTALHAIVTDTCILISRLLQHGDRATEIAAAMCTPPSLPGQIAAIVARHEGEKT